MPSKVRISLSLLFMLLISISLLQAKNRSISSESPNQDDGYLAFAEVMPAVQGGLAALYDKIKYPEVAMKAGIEGKVYVMAFINESGGVDDVKVIKGLGGGCDEAAVDAIKKAKFAPATNQGQPVKVKMSLPINFKLK